MHIKQPKGEICIAMKVIEVLDVFPKISETFILREILAMQKKGVDIEVFAFMRSNEDIVHPEVQEVRKISGSAFR